MNPAPPRQRLVVCLDGTWNNKDDATNVFHHFALALRGAAPAGGVTQTKYYDEGVGTGVLDRVKGGGFGVGLEENVRQAYDWLVEHYDDGDASAAADEIFVFGFSRGAYTARSLVGFIATCGLLRRGAPLSVNQLWAEHCVLGAQHEKRLGLWDRIAGRAPSELRRISDLVMDPWNIDHYEQQRAQAGLPAATGLSGTPRRPGQIASELRAAQELLVTWSRRVRITYLGIYDTVGAIGLDALAVPGLRSKVASHHNLRLTSLIRSCRHALAVDEHRSSFAPTPLLEYLGHGEEEDDGQGEELREMARKDSAQHWAERQEEVRQRVEQRWFAGAHSNVGGGYPDNVLAQRPLEWLLEGARAAGLQCEKFSYTWPAAMPAPRDSYAEFARPFWTEIIRGKRWYRPIDPEPDRRATTEPEPPGKIKPGFSFQSINERIDPTVLDNFGGEYRPPNVWGYVRRKREAAKAAAAEAAAAQQALAAAGPAEQAARQAGAARLAERAAKLAGDLVPLAKVTDDPPAHPWIGPGAKPHLVLALWAALTAAGLVAAADLFFTRSVTQSPPWLIFPSWLLGVVPFLFVLVDWGESRVNFALALGPSSARCRAFLDSIYWLRALGFALFVFGVLAAAGYLWSLGWHAAAVGDVWEDARGLFYDWWPAPVGAGAGLALAGFLDGGRRLKAALGGGFLGVVVALAAVAACIFLGWLGAVVLTPMFGQPAALVVLPPPSAAEMTGALLLLVAGFAYFLNAFGWTAEPMSGRNLGSIVALQKCGTPARVGEVLERWRRQLQRQWDPADADAKDGPAARTMREAARETLWRDIFGFIPIYAVVLGYGLWFAHAQLGWMWLGERVVGIPLWLLLPLAGLAADYAEDACHLGYLTAHEQGRPIPAFLPALSLAMTSVKFAVIVPAEALVLAAIAAGFHEVAHRGEDAGWRGTVALLLAVVIVLLLAGLAVAAVAGFLRARRKE